MSDHNRKRGARSAPSVQQTMHITVEVPVPTDPRVKELEEEVIRLRSALHKSELFGQHHADLVSRYWTKGEQRRQQIARALGHIERRNYGEAEIVLRTINALE